ncbi:integrase core domain-containing protein [Arthrobacter pascens]|uniref:integrase core domain-containing protein n=1 Tax=Arthrobacter pascens TaxID=1677 RepID=UPI0035564903
MTDNAFAYRLSCDFQAALAAVGAKDVLIKTRHPWENDRAERFKRSLQEGWAYRRAFTSNQARTEALQPQLDFYNSHRPCGSLGVKPPISRCRQPTD